MNERTLIQTVFQVLLALVIIAALAPAAVADTEEKE
jgi:hypothetical protein